MPPYAFGRARSRSPAMLPPRVDYEGLGDAVALFAAKAATVAVLAAADPAQFSRFLDDDDPRIWGYKLDEWLAWREAEPYRLNWSVAEWVLHFSRSAR